MTDTAEEKAPTAGAFPMTRQMVIVFSLAATAIFLLLSWVITVYFRKQSFGDLFAASRPITTQILLGLACGIAVAALVIPLLLKAGWLARLRNFIRDILAQIRPTGFDLLLVSLLAGFGEELFFRATLQPVLGLWLASLAFALAHTGLSVSPPKLLFAAFVFAMGLLLGTLYEQAGFVAAAVTHAVYDLLFLVAVKRYLRPAAAEGVSQQVSK